MRSIAKAAAGGWPTHHRPATPPLPRSVACGILSILRCLAPLVAPHYARRRRPPRRRDRRISTRPSASSPRASRARAGKVTVAHLGVSPALAAGGRSTRRRSCPPGFVLAVGTLEPRKNLPRLVEAYADARPGSAGGAPPRGRRRARLGSARRGRAALTRRARELLGYVSDAALAELYRRCAVFCYPSLGEGFGLPVLEAMAAGAAVVTSPNTSLPEVGGDAVEYSDPTDAAAISAALAGLLRDPARRAQLGARARERARGFSWAGFAAATLGALERAGGARS